MKLRTETALFGENELTLIIDYLSSYIDNTDRQYITKLKLEKLLVLFIKIGLDKKYLRSVNSLYTYDFQLAKYSSLIGTKYYLFGSIPSITKIDSVNDNPNLSSFSESLSKYLEEKNILQKHRNGYQLNSAVKSKTKSLLASNSQILGFIFSEILEKKKLINDNDLVVLTSCVGYEENISSLYSELLIFRKQFDVTNLLLEKNYRTTKHFTAINSGWYKFINYINGRAEKVITYVSDQLDGLLIHIWNEIWENLFHSFEHIDIYQKRHLVKYGLIITELNILIRVFYHDKEGCRIEEEIKSLLDILPLLKATEDIEINSLVKSFENGISETIRSKDKDVIIEKLLKIKNNIPINGIELPVSKLKLDKSNYLKRKPKKQKEINILIASPSDLVKERDEILNKLERKYRKDGHEQRTKKRIIVHGWEDVSSQVGNPQKTINRKLLHKNIDIVVAIFKHRLGTPIYDETNKLLFESGTVEEILYTLNDNAPLGMLYFYHEAPKLSLDNNQIDNIIQEWNRLKNFKSSIGDKIMYRTFKNTFTLLEILTTDLSNNIYDYFEK